LGEVKSGKILFVSWRQSPKLGKIWEKSGKDLGKIWERYGKDMGKIWESYRKTLGKIGKPQKTMANPPYPNENPVGIHVKSNEM